TPRSPACAPTSKGAPPATKTTAACWRCSAPAASVAVLRLPDALELAVDPRLLEVRLAPERLRGRTRRRCRGRGCRGDGGGDGVEADAAAFVALTSSRVGGFDRSQDIDGIAGIDAEERFEAAGAGVELNRSAFAGGPRVPNRVAARIPGMVRLAGLLGRQAGG